MERTAKASVMQWFRKLSPKKDARSKSLSIMKWFKKSTVDQTLAQSYSPLQNEIDVVPKTEFSASRQTLNNINIALHVGVGESSGEPSRKNHSVEGAEKKCCENKYCCGAFTQDSQDDLAVHGDDEVIKKYKNSKSTLIDNLRRADNNAHASEGSLSGAINETDGRRPSVVIKEIKNGDYVIYFAPSVDYGRTEVPDSLRPSLVENPPVRLTLLMFR